MDGKMLRALQTIGRQTTVVVTRVGHWAIFVFRALLATATARGLGGRLRQAIHEQGVRCVIVVTIVALFAGLVLGLQGFYVLSRFGSTGLLGTFVALTLTRELAPVLTSLMIVGQAGSAIAAEVGIHRNSEQIDALTMMGIDPIAYLVTPRLLAAVLVFPILTTLFSGIGTMGGYLSGCILLGLDPGVYWSAAHSSVGVRDVRECLLKALIFGVLTIAICCHSGFTADLRRGVSGARAVGVSTTQAVVFSSIATLAADYLITSLLV
jgi:phospholipid/cholesterol/gamma-HCH transport system permease protein